MGDLIATMLEHAIVGLGVDMVVLGAAGIYVLFLRVRGKPEPKWLPFGGWLVPPDKRRLDRLIAFVHA